MNAHMTDPFEHDDAAYVLGALSEVERARFEDHLATCAACAARVAELAQMPDLLAGITAADLADDPVADEPVPDRILAGLLTEVRRERRRRRFLVSGLAAAVAACVLALVVAWWPQSHTSPPSRAFTAAAGSPVQASAVISSKAWGTFIELRCHYAPGSDANGYHYAMYAETSTGARQRLGDWALPGGNDITYYTGTALSTAQIRALDITTDDGRTVFLRLQL